jgi:hypothetical protein
VRNCRRLESSIHWVPEIDAMGEAVAARSIDAMPGDNRPRSHAAWDSPSGNGGKRRLGSSACGPPWVACGLDRDSNVDDRRREQAQ